MSLDSLKGSLVRLHRNGLQGGLQSADAEQLVAALSQGTPLSDIAKKVGLDARLTRAVLDAQVGDVPTALAGQARIAARVAANSRQLRAAGTYPLVLAMAVVVAGSVVAGVLAPALATLTFTPGVVAWPPLVSAVAVSVVLMGLLSMAVLGRLRLPLLSGGWPAVDRGAFFESLDQLVQAGAPLPAALRASRVWCAPGPGAGAEALAQALEAGQSASGAPLLHPVESAMLVRAAQSGTLPQATAALSQQQQVRLLRILPDAITRIHIASLLLAGIAVAAVGIGFFLVYIDVLAR